MTIVHPWAPCENQAAWHLRGRVLTPGLRRTKDEMLTVETPGGWSFTWRRPRWVRDHYWFEVYNERTGAVVYQSDAFGLADAVDSCARAVEVARWAWVMELRHKALT